MTATEQDLREALMRYPEDLPLPVGPVLEGGRRRRRGRRLVRGAGVLAGALVLAVLGSIVLRPDSVDVARRPVPGTRTSPEVTYMLEGSRSYGMPAGGFSWVPTTPAKATPVIPGAEGGGPCTSCWSRAGSRTWRNPR